MNLGHIWFGILFDNSLSSLSLCLCVHVCYELYRWCPIIILFKTVVTNSAPGELLPCIFWVAPHSNTPDSND